MKKQPKTKGFSTIEGLLILVIVLILGGVGWYVWHSTKSTNEILNNAEKISDTQKKTPTSEQMTNYLSIKEWKVRLPLSPLIDDAYYVASTNTEETDGTPNAALLGIKSLDSAGCEAERGNKGGLPIAAILKSLPTDTDPVSGTLYTEEYPNGVTIEGYYYFYKNYSVNRPCTTQADLQQKLKDANNAFADAAKKITKE
jgi:hypothetical protein